MKAQIVTLALAVAALTALGCDRMNNDNTRPNAPTGTGSSSTTTPAEPAPVTPAEQPRPVPTANESDATRKEQVEANVDQLKVQRDKIYNDLYHSYAAGRGNAASQSDKSAPVIFKSHCDSVAKGEKINATDEVKAFFDKPDVQQKCAQALKIKGQIEAQKEQK